MSGDLTRLMKPVGPVAGKFGVDPAFLAFIMGPVGGGKTTECIAKAIRIGMAQHAVWDPARECHVKKCRGAVVRDTYPNLDRTVIKSWHQWFPKKLGRWSGEAPRTHSFTLDIGVRGEPGFHQLDMEVIFTAIGDNSVEDVLRGLELTWLWLNEADLLPFSIIELGVGRVGRYPGMTDGGCAFAQIFGDFNAPEEDNWTYDLCVDKNIDPELAEVLAAESGGKQPLLAFHQQPGGLDDSAENLHNLPGGRSYYLKQAALLRKSPDKKRRMIDNLFGPVRSGTVVFPEFIDDISVNPTAPRGHVREFEVVRGLPALIFADQGLMGAVLLAQLLPNIDQLRLFDEMARIFEDDAGHIEVSQIGGEAFGREVAGRLATRYPGLEIGLACCDPAGAAGEEAINHRSWRQDFQRGLGVHVKKVAVPGNAIAPRLKAVRDRLTTFVGTEPKLIVHPRCKMTRKGFNSKYVYRRVAVGGVDGGRFDSKPVKVQGFGDLMDAGQYGCFELAKGLKMAGGDSAAGAGRGGRRAITNESDYAMHGGRA